MTKLAGSVDCTATDKKTGYAGSRPQPGVASEAEAAEKKAPKAARKAQSAADVPIRVLLAGFMSSLREDPPQTWAPSARA